MTTKFKRVLDALRQRCPHSIALIPDESNPDALVEQVGQDAHIRYFSSTDGFVVARLFVKFPDGVSKIEPRIPPGVKAWVQNVDERPCAVFEISHLGKANADDVARLSATLRYMHELANQAVESERKELFDEQLVS